MARKTDGPSTDYELNLIVPSDDLKAAAIAAACEAYGINPQYLLSSKFDVATQTVMLLTHGGKKVKWRDGMDVSALSEIEITGVNPANANRKPIAGKAKD